MQQYLTLRTPASLIHRGLRFAAKSATALTLCAVLLTPVPGAAQGLFSPAITVDDTVITYYELEQRARFMGVLRVPGDLMKAARKELINDRLKLAAMAEAGIEPSEDEITAGMTELAGRANLSLNEFLSALQESGVDPETVRDFSRVGLGWRDLVGARFLSRARPTEAEIDRAMGQAGSGSVQVLLSELILPINEQNAAQVEDLARQVSQLRSYDSFSAAASQYSAAQSRERGGQLNWMPITKLPPQLQEVVLALSPGEVTDPLPLQGAVALFQMRDLREVTGRAQRYAAIDYAAYYLPGGRSAETLAKAQGIISQTDTCDDLYGVAKGQDPSVLDRVSLSPAEIDRDIAIELAKLDPGETSTAVTRNNGNTLVLLRLCGRTAELGEGESRETVANALTAQRVDSLSESYLEQLRADAQIKEK
ncbi:peptidylprolyl isomerase [Phaeobacter gallaeciensis]|uniref:peptidylprolyl isomerase n=1 Tax=Phaeobacter TaxID=302485 RepID=UPI002380508B|nr:peptidylprolyl isomerase [Phaeobacter gallaeciensis]MDE4276218.1 peptidylprolyl isomerase [Phaeobacter gallaeciensis]MDE4301447.1 peptidylprolyl isomerase [Phaeobacter gallaeciensis]MDE5186602.1 peptidylprolyl isomerase [Phaeobacter gallaeciensis]